MQRWRLIRACSFCPSMFSQMTSHIIICITSQNKNCLISSSRANCKWLFKVIFFHTLWLVPQPYSFIRYQKPLSCFNPLYVGIQIGILEKVVGSILKICQFQHIYYLRKSAGDKHMMSRKQNVFKILDWYFPRECLYHRADIKDLTCVLIT